MDAAAHAAATRRRARAHAVRGPPAVPVPGRRHDPRPFVRARSHGKTRPRRLRAGRAPCGAPGGAGSHRLRADEARSRRALRRAARADRGHAERRRPRVRAGRRAARLRAHGRRDPGAQEPARRARRGGGGRPAARRRART